MKKKMTKQKKFIVLQADSWFCDCRHFYGLRMKRIR